MSVVVGDVLLERDAPEALVGAKPTLQDGLFGDNDPGGSAIVDVHFVPVADGDVASLGKLTAAEQRVARKGGNNIHRACGFTDIVGKLRHGGGRGGATIGEGKNFCGRLPGVDEGVTASPSVGRTRSIPRSGRDGPIENTAFKRGLGGRNGCRRGTNFRARDCGCPRSASWLPAPLGTAPVYVCGGQCQRDKPSRSTRTDPNRIERFAGLQGDCQASRWGRLGGERVDTLGWDRF